MFHIVLVEPEIPPNTGNVIRLAANKLPMKTRFMVREEFGGDES